MVKDDFEKDRLLNDKLKLELPGIFNWMIKGLHRLKKRGYFNGHEFLGEAVQDLRDESNPVDVFFREHIEEDVVSGYKEEKGELYKKYDQWCKENGNRSLSAINFGKALYQKYHKFTPKKCQDHITGKRVWLNIKYVPFKNDNKQEITWEPAGVNNISDVKPVDTVQVSTGSQEDIDWET
jgi:phage/plasmid-associated DNA primase